MKVGLSTELISNEYWIEMKSIGMLKFSLEVSIGMAFAFTIISLVINIIFAVFSRNSTPFYQYVLIILVIPCFLGMLDGFLQTYFSWKFNYFVYEAKEQNMHKYKKIYMLSSIIQLFIMLIILKVFIDGKSLFQMGLLNYIRELFIILIISSIGGFFYGQREWKKFWKETEEKLNQYIGTIENIEH